jgi:hypothetical protein
MSRIKHAYIQQAKRTPKSHTQEGVGYASAEVKPRNFRVTIPRQSRGL